MSSMQAERWRQVQDVLDRVQSFGEDVDEATFADLCAGDASLAEEVWVLLAMDRDDSFLDRPAFSHLELFPEEEPGLDTIMPEQVVNGYALQREIGRGGMGVVYEAQQLEPLQRTVALKVIKWGMDTRQVISRFESERQALALMNHPGIASVYDAGATECGRPYFAMELVSGVPICEYCDTHKLGIRARLQLFIQVCGAIQHAHPSTVEPAIPQLSATFRCDSWH